MFAKLPKREIVLLGVGHTNAHILKMWKMHALEQTRLTCISNFPKVTYSGMLPGVLAGQYPIDRMQIDLVRLCSAHQARLIIDQVRGLDLERREILFEHRTPVRFDALSIGVGSIPSQRGLECHDDLLVPIKPMQTFLSRLQDRLQVADALAVDRALRIVVVGGGAGGCEIAMCLPARILKWLGQRSFQLSVVHGASELVTGLRPGTRRAVQRVFQQRGVSVYLNRRATRIGQGFVHLDDGSALEADLVLWATSAVGHPWLGELGLPLDDRGFLRTATTLEVESASGVFAVGDCGTMIDAPTPKAGVYAVRQGKVLWENLQRTLRGQELQEYAPQSDFLKLLNTGDGKAIAEYKGTTWYAKWCWWLKDRIDAPFMDKYQVYEPMKMKPVSDLEPMRCTGCGGKVGSQILRRALSRLEIPANPYVLVGLDQPDDAAVIRADGEHPLTVTTDFFTAPLQDNYLNGRIAALNALSDAFAMGAEPTAALAVATLPIGTPQAQEDTLYDLLAGAMDEFRRTDTVLAGGHTIEGPQLSIGFTLLANQRRPPLLKSKLRDGDALVLTKPIGTGVLLVGLMQARCEADWYTSLLESMLRSNQVAASLAERFSISAMTDVTGFGLAGHLLEMLRASRTGAQLGIAEIPVLPGASELVRLGVESTLAPANREVESAIASTASQKQHATYSLLFDPQTSGGMLLAVAPHDADKLVCELIDQGVDAAKIGAIQQPGHPESPLRLVDSCS